MKFFLLFFLSVPFLCFSENEVSYEFFSHLTEYCRNNLKINEEIQYKLFHTSYTDPITIEYAYKIGHLNAKIHTYSDIVNKLKFNNLQKYHSPTIDYAYIKGHLNGIIDTHSDILNQLENN